MSLISDALKTAQRERSGREAAESASSPQPLLEGFFPYVSASRPAGRFRSGRMITIASFSATIVIAAAGWVFLPAIKKAVGTRGKPATVVPGPAQQGVLAPKRATPPPGEKPFVAVVEARDTIAPPPVEKPDPSQQRNP